MAGITMRAARLAALAWMIDTGGPLESGNVDLVLAHRPGPITDEDVYDADAVVIANGIVPVVGVTMTGPYVTPDGDDVVTAGCHDYLTTDPTPPDPFDDDTVFQWWLISQDVVPVLMAAGLVDPPIPLTAGGVTFSIPVDVAGP